MKPRVIQRACSLINKILQFLGFLWCGQSVKFFSKNRSISFSKMNVTLSNSVRWLRLGSAHTGPTSSRCHSTPNHHCFGNFNWTSSSWDSVLPVFLQTRRLDFQLNAKIYFSWKEDFGPLSNSPVPFLLSPDKTLLALSLVQKWLGSPFPEDVWAWWLLMHWLQLQSTPCEALTSVWISFAWQYSQACGHPCCLCTFSYPISSFRSTLHLICFDTAHCKQPHLSVMTLCDLPSLWRVSMIVFWIIAKSAVFPIIVVSKNKRYPEFIL